MVGPLVALALATSVQVAAHSDGAAQLNCRVVTVSGATLDFPFELRGSGETAEARVPRRNAPFVRITERRFHIPDLPNTLAFDVSPIPGNAGQAGYFEMTLSLSHEGVRGFPVANGYCTSRRISSSGGALASFEQLSEAALDAAADAHLPCYALTLQGIVSRFRTSLDEHIARHFEPLDAVLWSSARASPENGFPAAPGPSANLIVLDAIFGDRVESENPTGHSTGYLDETRALAVRTILFTMLGRESGPENHNALAICAIRMQRRP